MSKRVAVTEKLRKEIRNRIAGLTPNCRWHVIARDERGSVEHAYLRIDKDNKAESFSDDAVTSMIYDLTVRRQMLATRTLEWLAESDLWTGMKFYKTEEENNDDECK